MHRFSLGGYLLQKTKEMLLITSKRKDIVNVKGKVFELVILILGRFSIDFRELRERYAVKFAASIQGEGVLANIKSQSGLGTMQA